MSFMSGIVFVDTNVLIYAIDQGDRAKHKSAREWRTFLWRSRRGRLSFQVLQELYAQGMRKSPSAKERLRDEIRDYAAWSPTVVDDLVLETAFGVQDRYKLSFWDSLIVAAAKVAGCRYLLTEDLSTGQDFDGLVVVSPFKTRPEELDRT